MRSRPTTTIETTPQVPQSESRFNRCSTKILLGSVATAGCVLLTSGCGTVTGITYQYKGQTYSTPTRYIAPIEQAAKYCPAITVAIITAQILQESSFDDSAVSSADAVGAEQMTDTTWLTLIPEKNPTQRQKEAWLAKRYDINVEVPEAGRYLCALYYKHGGSAQVVLDRPRKEALEDYYAGGRLYLGAAYANSILQESYTVREIRSSSTSSAAGQSFDTTTGAAYNISSPSEIGTTYQASLISAT